MCNNILNILKFIIKFNKYIIIVIDLEHFQNFPHCGVHLKRWKKKVHQVRKKNEHMLASKWINENITELICILTILFPFLLLKFIHYNEHLSSTRVWTILPQPDYSMAEFYFGVSFCLLAIFFFFNRKWKIFAVQDFWNFWWELIFAIFFSSSRTSTRNKTWHV